MAFKGQRNYQKSFGLSVHLGNNALRRLQGGLQGRRNLRRAGGAGLDRLLHILADQLALFQPGADYAHNITTTPSNFQTFLRPWIPI